MAFSEIHTILLLVLTTSFKTGGTVGRSNNQRGVNTRFFLLIPLFIIKWFLFKKFPMLFDFWVADVAITF